LTTLYLAGAKNTDCWLARNGDLQRAFPLDVPMVPLSAIIIAADGEHLTCGGFSHGKTICLGNFEFITDYFGGLGLSPRRGNNGAAFMGSSQGGASTPRWAMIEDLAEEFLTVSSGEGSFGLLSPRRRDTGASLAPTTTTPWMENALAIVKNQPPHQAMSRLSRRAVGASPCSTAHHRARGSAMVKQAHRQAGRYHGSTTCATAA
jgi:hypothetical protein